MSNTRTPKEKYLGDYKKVSTAIIHQHPRNTYHHLRAKSQIGFSYAFKQAHSNIIGNISGQNKEV